MRQHPIPQNILDVEFKLFTKFTIKEFTYMAIGIGFGGIFLYFFTKGQLPGIIAFPIFLVSSAAGLFLGLVPINDQKADVFLRNYFTAITQPTRRVWRDKDMMEKEKPQDITQGKMSRDANKPEKTKIVGTTKENLQKNQFIEKEELDQIDKEEQQRLQQIEQHAQQTGAKTAPAPQPAMEKSTPAQATPTQDPNSIAITKLNLSQYAVTLPGEVKLIGTLNILVEDKSGQPISDAVVTIKDSVQRVISAYRSNRSGLILTEKLLQPGTYYANVTATGKKFPNVQILLEDNTPIVFKIVEI